ncbi:MAG: vWA domain-containing protein [Dehalococcoidia bacterium]
MSYRQLSKSRICHALLAFVILATLLAAACSTSEPASAPTKSAAPDQSQARIAPPVPAAPASPNYLAPAPSAPASTPPASGGSNTGPGFIVAAPYYSPPSAPAHTPSTTPMPPPPLTPWSPPSNSGTIGLAVGGAKDVNNFRENIRANYLPLPTDITYEGLFYDYYFDTGNDTPCNKLYCPSYSCAVSPDPFSGKPEYYLSVGLNSGMKDSDFARKKLNLVVVLDISGSMSSPFNEYYYDQFGVRQELNAWERNTQKIEVAKDAIKAILGKLNRDDHFGIVLYNDRSYLLQGMSEASRENLDYAMYSVRQIAAGGSTNLSAGMQLASDLLDEYRWANPSDYENRVIFLTDAMANTGETGEYSLRSMLRSDAGNKIYTTYVGIGVDFNTELIDYITQTRGANYYSVHSPGEFVQRMNDEFDYMVTPLIFNLVLSMEGQGWQIEQVYGSPEADKATGQIMKVNTLFPSKKEAGQTKGGLILLKLRRTGGENDLLKLRVTYEDRSGNQDGSEALVYFENTGREYYDNNGIRKGILLSRYANLIKDWLIDERGNARQVQSWVPMVNSEDGIIIPVAFLGTWERQSLPLTVSYPYRSLFRDFGQYFSSQMGQISDSTLSQELDILYLLGQPGYRGD